MFATTGQSFTFTVMALDAFGNAAVSYAGMVHFSTSDGGAGVVLPPNSPLQSGVGTFSATLKTPGTQTITATDTVQNSGPLAITGTTSPLAVRGLVITGFTVTPTGFVLNFNEAFDPTTLDIYGTTIAGGANIAANGQGQDIAISKLFTPVLGSMLFADPSNPGVNPNFTSLTFVRTGGLLQTGGQYEVTLSPTLLTGLGSGIKDCARRSARRCQQRDLRQLCAHVYRSPAEWLIGADYSEFRSRAGQQRSAAE